MQGARWTAPALLALTVAGVAPSAHAFRFDLGGIQAAWENRVVLGATMRLDERNDRLIGKLNVNPDLCPDDCISFSGNPAPNQRLVDAPGAFLGANFDNGNLNYDQYDLTAAQLRLESELKGSWGKVDFKISGVGFYDAVNYDFDAFHPDTALQPRHTPRPDNIEAQVGLNFHLLEAFVSVPFDVFDQKFYLSVGEQRIRWGQSTFVALGSLDVINPPDQNRLRFPGAQIASVFEPVGLVVLTTRLSANLQAEMLYQYHWQPVTPSASGSFFSVNDIAGGGEYAVISLGQFSEDSPPYGIGFKGATPRLITSTPTSVPVDHFSGQPDDGGTYGLRLNYYAAHLNGGTNLGFYALNYSSRLPYASAYATDKSCLRDIPPILSPPDLGPLQGLVDAINDVPGLPSLSANGVGALLACTGFNGTLNPTGLGEEPLPIDTLDLFLEYPEDIHMFGIAFTTNMGHWSLAGEYVYHPNLPLQVSLSDLLFAGLQPALPEDDVNLVIAAIPSARHAIPDYLATRYRDDPVSANELIHGYERFDVQQIDFTAIRIFGAGNFFRANQIIWLVEAGATHVIDMPGIDDLQIEAFAPNCTHHSPGADGTGSNGVPDARRLNPTQSSSCFADELSMGWRTLVKFTYDNALFGWGINPLLFFFHDVYGTAPVPIQNFVEGRKRLVLGTEVEFNPDWSAQVMLDIYWGSGDVRNMLQDRDNISLSVSYNF